MKIKIIDKLILSVKASLFIALTTVTTNAFAEYYFVYPAPGPAPCGAPSCAPPPCVKHHVRRPHRIRHVRHYRRVRCPRPGCPTPRCGMPGYTAWYAAPPRPVPLPCNSCGSWVPTNAWPWYEEGYFYREPHEYYGMSYNPDLTTGDDNPMIDPEMDIDK